MASGKHIPCGPCSFDDVTKDASKWCTKCEEGLCEDCEKSHRRSKSSRNHEVISVEDYHKIEHILISQVCEHHGENLEWFCKSHDEVLCVVCVPSKHKACSDVIPISVNSSNARQSTALSDLEETVEETLCNVKDCMNDRYSAIKKIEKQELAVKTLVLETRTKINDQLDKLQEKLLHELRSSSASCKSNYTEILQKLKSTEEMLTKIKEQTIHMKQFSSNIQVFLGTRQINMQLQREIKFIKNEISTTQDYEIKVAIHDKINNLSSEVEDFGQIKIMECAAKLHFRDPQIKQAQIGIETPTLKNIMNINLQLIKSFQMKGTNSFHIRGCAILPNGNLLISNYTKNNQLHEYSEKGEHIRDIPVSGMPYDIAVIDHNSICVSYGDANFVEIIDTNTLHVEKEIGFKSYCYGVSFDNGRLYIRTGNSTIQVLDLLGKLLDTRKIPSNSILFITTSTDRIFCSDNNKVYCYLKNGKEIWQVKSEFVSHLNGVTVDNNRNVYVIGHLSNHLMIIQHDGKESRILLTESDGLDYPCAVDFDLDKRTILICNKGGKVALYKVV